MVTDIFTPGLTAGNPLALPALNHSIVSSGARFMLASTLHYGAPGPVDLASIAHVLGTLSIPKNILRAHAIANLPPRTATPPRRKPCTGTRLPLRFAFPYLRYREFFGSVSTTSTGTRAKEYRFGISCPLLRESSLSLSLSLSLWSRNFSRRIGGSTETARGKGETRSVAVDGV